MTNAESYRLEALRFFDRLGYTQEVFQNVARGVMNLGVAHNTKKTEYAMVALNRGNEDSPSRFRLYLNEEKFATLTRQERAAVIWHELNHILNRHLDYKHLTEQGMIPTGNRLNYAAEVVCNDIVTHHGLLLPDFDKLITGEKLFSHNTYPADTKEVYDMLEDMDISEEAHVCASHGDGGAVEGNGSSQSAAGNSGDEVANAASGDGKEAEGAADGAGDEVANAASGGAGDNEGENSEDNDSDLEDAFNHLVEGMDVSWLPGSEGGKVGGDGASHNGVKVSVSNQVPDRWEKFLKKVDPKLWRAIRSTRGLLKNSETRADWTARRRSVAHLPGAQLPSRKPFRNPKSKGGDIRPTVVVAVDQSGSLGSDLAQKVMELAVKIPTDVAKVILVPYASYAGVVDFDGKSHEEIMEEVNGVISTIGCGTAFSPIYRELRDYGVDPEKATVINFTDGGDVNGAVEYIVAKSFMVDVTTKYEDDTPFGDCNPPFANIVPQEQWYNIQECASDF